MPTASVHHASGLPASTPEEQGLSSQRVAAVLRQVREEMGQLHSLLIARHGHLILESYLYPFGPDWRHGQASCTKAVLSSLFGVALQQGHIQSLDQRMVDFFPGRTMANRDARKERITLEHLLSMSSGLRCIITRSSEVTMYEMREHDDWVQYMLDQPMDYEPGTQFVYNSGACHVLSAILTEATGMSALDYARQHLFGPLGIEDVKWPADPQGYTRGWGHLELLPVDMAKFGRLFLNDGVWEGTRLLPPGWVAESTRYRFDPDPRGSGYALLWWLHNPFAEPRWFYAAGIGVQTIGVIPSAGLVVACSASADREVRDRLFEAIERELVATAQDGPLPPDAEGLALLQREIEAAARPHPRPVPPLPAVAGQVSGRTYALDANRLGWQTLSLAFATDEPTARASVNGAAPVQVGLDGVPRVTTEADPTQRTAWQGEWQDGAFVLEMDTISQYRRWRLTLAFEGDRVRVSSHESANGADAQYEGRAA